MKRLVYVSRACIPFAEEHLHELAQEAIERNRASGVTGYLHYRRKIFLQYVEGTGTDLDDLLIRLNKDARHEIEQIVRLEDRLESVFPDWSMRYLADDALRRIQVEDLLDTLLSQMGQTALCPTTLRASAERLIEKLAERDKSHSKSLFETLRIPSR